MGRLEKINEDFLYSMRKEHGVLGAWEFGSGMRGTRDEYSDIDMVFLIEEEEFDRIDRGLQTMLESV